MILLLLGDSTIIGLTPVAMDRRLSPRGAAVLDVLDLWEKNTPPVSPPPVSLPPARARPARVAPAVPSSEKAGGAGRYRQSPRQRHEQDTQPDGRHADALADCPSDDSDCPPHRLASFRDHQGRPAVSCAPFSSISINVTFLAPGSDGRQGATNHDNDDDRDLDGMVSMDLGKIVGATLQHTTTWS